MRLVIAVMRHFVNGSALAAGIHRDSPAASAEPIISLDELLFAGQCRSVALSN